ncbi:MAG: FAD-dependent oxidoreductase, partial [Verrucomicrobiota bacterium]
PKLSQRMVVILGAGLAGLTCAKVLAESGFRDFLLLEKGPGPGGRVTSETGPFGRPLDRGFQVLLDGYPAAKRHLDIDELEPRYFESGALLAFDGSITEVDSPLRRPFSLQHHAFNNTLPLSDKVKFARLAWQSFNRANQDSNQTIAELLQAQGFSSLAISRFFRPFFGGVFLDPDLESPVGPFLHYFYRFATSRALIPRNGMQAIPRQLEQSIPGDRIRYYNEVVGIDEGSTSIRLHLKTGKTVEADRLVLATDQATTARLLHLPPPPLSRRTKSVFFTSPRAAYPSAKLVLPSDETRVAHHYVQLSNVVPEWRQNGDHLFSATVLSPHFDNSEEMLFETVSGEIERDFPDLKGNLRPLQIISVPEALPTGPLDTASIENPKLQIAGDHTLEASIDGAMTSGEKAAEMLLAQCRRPSHAA